MPDTLPSAPRRGEESTMQNPRAKTWPLQLVDDGRITWQGNIAVQGFWRWIRDEAELQELYLCKH